MSQPVLSSELFATSLNSKSFPWIHVSFAHVIDQKFQNVYKVVLKTNSDIEWVVMHRFKIYRNLFKKLSELNIHLSNPFPPTFFKSKLGIGLSNVQITERADMLEKWIFELFSIYGDLSEPARYLMSNVFDASQSEDEILCLQKLHSYLDYMSKTYEELHIREPSIDLINRFKMDLERARSMTRTDIFNVRNEADSAAIGDINIHKIVGAGPKDIGEFAGDNRDRSLTGPPSCCSIDSIREDGNWRSTIV